jgi:hypothetical protein
MPGYFKSPEPKTASVFCRSRDGDGSRAAFLNGLKAWNRVAFCQLAGMILALI